MRFLNAVIHYFALIKWPSWSSTSCPYAGNSWHTQAAVRHYTDTQGANKG